MCSKLLETKPCLNYKCPHNLFWEGLKLNSQRVHITGKALHIRNCCYLIHEPWTSEEIAQAWGLSKKRIKQSEAAAWRKLKKRNSCKELMKETPSQFFPHKDRTQKSGFHPEELMYG